MSDKTGIITKIQRELFYVSIGNNVYPSKAKGNFRNKKITEEKHQKLTKRNTILLIIVGILLILFLYTPFKILIF